MDAYWLVTPEDGDRYPVGPPILRMLTANFQLNFLIVQRQKASCLFCRHSLMVKKRAYTSPKHRPDKPECAGSSPAGGTIQCTDGGAAQRNCLQNSKTAGSNPARCSIMYPQCLTAARQSPKLLVGVRISQGTPSYTPLDFWVGPWPFKPKRRVRFPYGVPSLRMLTATFNIRLII